MMWRFLSKKQHERCTHKGMEPEAKAQCTGSTPSLTPLQPSLTTLQLLTCPRVTSSRDATLAVSMHGRVGGSSGCCCTAEERSAGDESALHCAWTTEAGGEGGEQAHEQHHLYVGASHALVCW